MIPSLVLYMLSYVVSFGVKWKKARRKRVSTLLFFPSNFIYKIYK